MGLGSAAGAGDSGDRGAPGQDASRRVREHARWLREEAQRIREGSPDPGEAGPGGSGPGEAGPGGFGDRIGEEAGARFTGEQDWDSASWPGGPGWTEWPGRRGWDDWARMRGRRGWTGALDFGTLKDLERVAVQFTSDLRKLAMQSTAAGENAITDLRTILEDALDRVKTEIFGGATDKPGEHDSAVPDEPAPPAPGPGSGTKDSPA